MQHRRFGASSEKTELPDRFNLFNEAEVLSDSDEPQQQQITTQTHKKRKGKREAFYKGLPTEQIVHEIPENECICPECGGLLHAYGHEVLRREVKVIPAQINAVEHVQTVYECRDCTQKSDADTLPMVKSHVPAPVFSGSGIHISRQTMANWIIYAAAYWLTPIYDLLYAELLKNDISHADETTVTVVREDGRTASHNSYMWMYHTDRDASNQVALFEYQPTREGKHPLAFLEGFRGFLHVDA